LGNFNTAEAAEKAYLKAAEKFFGEFSLHLSRSSGPADDLD
jgi:hypothetical protein